MFFSSPAGETCSRIECIMGTTESESDELCNTYISVIIALCTPSLSLFLTRWHLQSGEWLSSLVIFCHCNGDWFFASVVQNQAFSYGSAVRLLLELLFWCRQKYLRRAEVRWVITKFRKKKGEERVGDRSHRKDLARFAMRCRVFIKQINSVVGVIKDMRKASVTRFWKNIPFTMKGFFRPTPDVFYHIKGVIHLYFQPIGQKVVRKVHDLLQKLTTPLSGDSPHLQWFHRHIQVVWLAITWIFISPQDGISLSYVCALLSWVSVWIHFYLTRLIDRFFFVFLKPSQEQRHRYSRLLKTLHIFPVLNHPVWVLFWTLRLKADFNKTEGFSNCYTQTWAPNGSPFLSTRPPSN